MATLYWTSTSSTDPTVGANWSTGSAPVNGDDVYITAIPGLSLANIGASDMHLVVLNSLTISQTYTGTIGTAGSGGYWQIAATTWTIGTPATDGTSASGSGRIKLDFGTNAFTGTVLNTASIGTDTPSPPVLVKGTNASNVLNVLSGIVGVAVAVPGETATLGTINVEGSNAQAFCGSGVTWTTATCASSGKLTLNSGSSGTLDASGGATVTCYGTSLVATVTNSATIYFNNRPAAGACITTLNNLPGGTVDFSGNPASGTVTTFNPYPDSQVNVDASNSNHITFTTTSRQNVATVQYS